MVDRLIIEVIGADEHSNIENAIEFQKPEPIEAPEQMLRSARRDFRREQWR